MITRAFFEWLVWRTRRLSLDYRSPGEQWSGGALFSLAPRRPGVECLIYIGPFNAFDADETLFGMSGAWNAWKRAGKERRRIRAQC